MLKKLSLAFAAAICLALTAVSADAKPLKIATTIDFLDYVFEYKGAENYYPVEEYEKVIADLAKNGFQKVYLRVNVCGLTHYPSTVSALYGTDDAFHWTIEKPALRLIETYKHYDVCIETIRLCKKYGLECWAWESLFDDAGICYPPSGNMAKYQKAYDRLGGWALLDPYYLKNPDALAERLPSKVPAPIENAAELNAQAARLPIARILFTNDPDRALGTPLLKKEQLAILVSDDNSAYTPYKGDFEFKSGVAEGTKRSYIEIAGLNIPQKYVKLGRKGVDVNDKRYQLVLSRAFGQVLVYNTEGESIATVWGWGEGSLEKGGVGFQPLKSPAAWDYMSRFTGCRRGVPEPSVTDRYYYGVAEFTVPKAMKHKVDRFVELAKYDFDGFMFNTRCHSAMPGIAAEYGFNPEVLKVFRKRTGRLFKGTDADVKEVFQIRAESIAAFFKNCKEKSGGRPIYLSGPVPLELKNRSDYNTAFGPLPWLYKQYFKDGSIDGVIMIGRNFSNSGSFADYFTKEITGGKDIKIGIFREMMNCPRDYDFYKDMQELRASNLDEVELYETLMFQFHPVLNQVVNGTAKPGWKSTYKR